jgi:multiple sugar transport system substrate-binding protein
MRRIFAWLFALVLFPSIVLTAEPVTIEFLNWWTVELPPGECRAIMDGFEAQNPGIKVKLVDSPFSAIHDQIVTGAATGTLADVMSLNGAWVNEFASQGSIASLTDIMASVKYDASQLNGIVKVGSNGYQIDVISFVYPLFVNLDMLHAAGIQKVPETWNEFATAAKKMTQPKKNQYGWVLPLSLQTANGIENDVMPWMWMSGGRMLTKDGKPNFNNPDVIKTLKFIQSMYKAGSISPGSFAKQEVDKTEEFVNGRVGMMIHSLALLNTVRQRKPDFKVGLAALPVSDGFKGTKSMSYASWGIGINKNSKHPDEAWKLIAYLMSPEVNSRLASVAHGFPGNVKAPQPAFVSADPEFGKVFEAYKSSKLVGEFFGLPTAEELMRTADREIQLMLDGKQTAEKAAANVQANWSKTF